MSKSTSAKQWFYSLGVRSLSPDYIGPWPRPTWAEWARMAFWRGQDEGRWARARQTTKQWSTQKLADSLER